MKSFFWSLLTVVCEMAPYLLLGFLIAGILHVYVPQGFYRKYLSNSNKWAVLWAALLGIPLPLCSCGVIPTAIGLRNEKASKGAVASFLIATPQTGIDSILATYALMGPVFAIARPLAATLTGIVGGTVVSAVGGDDAGGEESGDEPRRHRREHLGERNQQITYLAHGMFLESDIIISNICITSKANGTDNYGKIYAMHILATGTGK